MRLFRRSSQRKFGRQSNSSSGNNEIEFPSKYKNWKWQSKAKWIYTEEYASFFHFDLNIYESCRRLSAANGLSEMTNEDYKNGNQIYL